LLAVPAALAETSVDDCHRTAEEFVLFQLARLEDKLQVGSVHIGIGQHCFEGEWAVVCQVGEGRRHAGFASATLTAEDDQLLHIPTVLFDVLITSRRN
jgi:hypothetical protein